MLLTGAQGGYVTNLADGLKRAGTGLDPNSLRALLSTNESRNGSEAEGMFLQAINVNLDFTGATIAPGGEQEIRKSLNDPEAYRELIGALRAGKRS